MTRVSPELERKKHEGGYHGVDIRDLMTATFVIDAASWGPWRLDPENRHIYLDDSYPHEYWIELDRCTSSAAVLDWIIQVAQKTWAGAAVIAGLVNALDDVLEPQQHLCSGGNVGTPGRRLTRKRIAELAAKAAEDGAPA